MMVDGPYARSQSLAIKANKRETQTDDWSPKAGRRAAMPAGTKPTIGKSITLVS